MHRYANYTNAQFIATVTEGTFKVHSIIATKMRGFHWKHPQLVRLMCILGDPCRVSQSGREKRRDKSFQAQAEKPLGTDSHRTISKRSRECWFLIGHKKCFVLLCPIGEQHLLSSFREFVHDGYWLDHGLSGSCTKEMHAVRNLSVWYKSYISKYW